MLIRGINGYVLFSEQVEQYRYDNHSGTYDVLIDGVWYTLENSGDIVDVIEDSPNAVQYFDDTTRYCEQ